ncbi:hypothetical protein F4782DRAFT_548785 [Xylaria castorea]|nr:hypothetical protein F4782DRAFT_548785 [Xylaria castorea]
MCRRIITHRMHHDVAAAMVMDPTSPNPVVYANPLRTNFHRCELAPPHVNWLLNSRVVKCAYHTCCLPDERVEYCEDFIAYLDSEGDEEEDFEPEECDAFILEHHHERLPYFGNEGAYRAPVPATWREMVRIRGSDADLFPGFAHKGRAIWEERCFAECEKLFTLENDTVILYASLQGLRAIGAPCSWGTMQAARANVLESEGRLHEQRRENEDLRVSALAANARELTK